MKAVVNKDLCIGCGLCCSVCGDVFVMNDEGLAEGIKETTDENRELVQEAIDSCPISAISEE